VTSPLSGFYKHCSSMKGEEEASYWVPPSHLPPTARICLNTVVLTCHSPSQKTFMTLLHPKDISPEFTAPPRPSPIFLNSLISPLLRTTQFPDEPALHCRFLCFPPPLPPLYLLWKPERYIDIVHPSADQIGIYCIKGGGFLHFLFFL
jgi:hypothetical protein